VPVAIQKRALEETAKYVQVARQLYKRNFLMPTVAFDLRGTTAGIAYLNKNLVRYNAVLLTENVEDFLGDTVPHEIAHLIAHQVYGKRISAHGQEWKSVMRAFGVEPSRTHSFDTTNSAVGGTYHFTCRCGTVHKISSRRKKAAYAGRMICKRCNTRLVPAGIAVSGVSGTRAPTLLPTANPRLPVQPLSAPPVTRPVATPTTTRPKVAPPVSTPSPLGPRPATPAMLQFALSLAHRLGISLQPEHTASFASCASFIERYKTLEPKVSPPSARQLQYAQDIARRRGLTLSADTLASAAKLSAWISANR
jgi:SprT protein